VPIFVYRCGCGHRFERIVRRDAAAPDCPQCGSTPRKVPAGPSLARNAADGAQARSGLGSSVPIPWRGTLSGGPERMKREVEFRRGLEAKSREGIRTPGGPDTRTAQTD
jgi:putative FmdB family regulatory protein